MILASFLSLAVLDGEAPLVLSSLSTWKAQCRAWYWQRLLSGHSTAGVTDLKPPEDDQLVPLVDLLNGVTGWHFWASRRDGTPASYWDWGWDGSANCPSRSAVHRIFWVGQIMLASMLQVWLGTGRADCWNQNWTRLSLQLVSIFPVLLTECRTSLNSSSNSNIQEQSHALQLDLSGLSQ